MLSRIITSCAAALTFASFAVPAFAQCPDWKPGFGRAGTNDVVYALASFDDGSGSALYAGGAFTTAGDAHARHAARWQGLRWSSLSTHGPGSPVVAYAVFDSGAGPELYAARTSAQALARWDGAEWVPLPTNPNGGVHALTVFDDGTGAALYATGYFTSIGAVPANRIAKWDGTSWSALGSGLEGAVSPGGWSLTVHDDGTGPALYVGGHFTTAGGLAANGIAKWKTGAWSTLGSGMSGGTSDTTVFALLGGSVGVGSPRLYAAGEFTSAGGVSANRIASWDGSTWSSLGTGTNGYALDLELFDDGSGVSLYAAGGFSDAGGATARSIARWDGVSWSALSADVDFGYVSALTVHDDGTGPALFAGGDFRTIGGKYVWHIAKWTGSAWHPLGRGQGLDAAVSALSTFDDGTGNALYAGGNFFSGSGIELNHIGRWDGKSWSALGEGLNGSVGALRVFDDGTGSALYAGGFFNGTGSGSTTLSCIARWDGTSWSNVDIGISNTVRTLTVFDDGNGPALYAGGSFTFAGSVLADNLGRWDGTTWSAVGGGVSGGSFGPGVNALAVFDDGTGPALYVGGSFTTAGSTAAKHIARWDGTAWSPLGSGMNDRVLSLTVFDDGTGRALYAGGVFTNAGGTSAKCVARWDGSSWSEAATGLTGFNAEVRALGVFDDGAGVGPVLVAGGQFGLIGGGNIARLTGTRWKPLGGAVSESGLSIDPAVSALAVFDDGSAAGTELYVGGNFTATPSSASLFIARLGCVGTTIPYCFGDIVNAGCPCFNFTAFGDQEGCSNSQGTGGRLRGSGRVSLANDGFVLSGSGMTNGTALYFQGTVTAALGAGTPLGDGLACTGGALVRLKVKSNVGGASSFPGIGDPPVSVNGLVAAPGSRTYQVLYRDTGANCTPDTFNLTNAVQVGWTP